MCFPLVLILYCLNIFLGVFLLYQYCHCLGDIFFMGLLLLCIVLWYCSGGPRMGSIQGFPCCVGCVYCCTAVLLYCTVPYYWTSVLLALYSAELLQCCVGCVILYCCTVLYYFTAVFYVCTAVLLHKVEFPLVWGQKL